MFYAPIVFLIQVVEIYGSVVNVKKKAVKVKKSLEVEVDAGIAKAKIRAVTQTINI